MIIIPDETVERSVKQVENVTNASKLRIKDCVNCEEMDRTVLYDSVRREMTRDECRKCLRYLELDAYSSMVSVLRAQGPFTVSKQKLLQELAKVLHISNERHRAEVRRAVNDEKLAMIAEQLSGPNSVIDWTMEGRRTIPLLPRLKAHNAFTMVANSLSFASLHANNNHPVQKNEEHILETKPENDVQIKSEELSVAIETDSCLRPVGMSCRKRTFNESVAVDGKQIKEDKKTTQEDVRQLSSENPDLIPIVPASHNKILVLSSSASSIISNNESEDEPPCINKSSTSCSTSTVIATCSSSNVNTFSKAKTAVVQNKISSKVSTQIPTTVTNCISQLTKDSAPSEYPVVQMHGTVPSLQRPEATTVNSTSVKIIPSIVQSNIKNLSPIKSTVPKTVLSNGPGPPDKQVITTLACKKLPVTIINHQNTPNVDVTLNPEKTVNITNHPTAKLTSKTNVIVIQKGHNKSIMLSHAGKEVLGKVIMGGKKLAVTTQQNSNTVTILPHHNLNNGNQISTLLPTSNKVHVELLKTNAKEEENNERHSTDNQSSLEDDSIVISTTEENILEETTGTCKDIHSQKVVYIGSARSLENENNIRSNCTQLVEVQEVIDSRTD